MNKEYSKIQYEYEKIKLTKVFEHPDYKSYLDEGINTTESESVFGKVYFPPMHEDRAYTLACFVMSMDGKIAYPDNPAGPVIAQSNFLDKDGATADFWVLNLFRSSMDAIFVGAGTMQKEPNSTVHVFDENLEKERILNDMPQAPWAIVCSLDGTDIPYEDTLFDNQPSMINTSPFGLEIVKQNFKKPFYIIGPYKDENEIKENKYRILSDFKDRGDKIPVIVTGEGKVTDSNLILKILKIIGIEKVMVESPSYCHYLLQLGLLDEFILNYSCVYIGGNAIGFGNGFKSTTSTEHPHTEVLSIHSHSPSFFYFRHKVVYGVNPSGYLGVIY